MSTYVSSLLISFWDEVGGTRNKLETTTETEPSTGIEIHSVNNKPMFRNQCQDMSGCKVTALKEDSKQHVFVHEGNIKKRDDSVKCLITAGSSLSHMSAHAPLG